MKNLKTRLAVLLLSTLCLLTGAYGQSTPTGSPSAQVPPPLIQFSNVATDEGGNPLSGVANITFSLYNSQQGGEALWTETQNNIQLDATGHYSVELGITQPNGVPTSLFTTGEARWLGVQIAGQAQRPRIFLLSVPYALKAGDAATIGGLPPSAFVLAAPLNGASSAPVDASAMAQGSAPPPSNAITGTGTVNYLPLWDTTSDIISSVLFQSGKGSTAKIGINTTTPASTLDVKGGGTIRGTLSLPSAGTATASKGFNSQPQTLAASAFNSSTSTAVNQTFQWQAEPAGNDTSTPSGTLNLLFGEGTAKPSETGLHISNNGQITFATGQTFPGTGTGDGSVTSIGSGAGLTGGPITSSGSLSIATGGVTNAMLANPSLTITPGTALTGGGLVSLGGSTTLNVDTTKVPLLVASNTFTGNQTTNGNLTATGMVSGSGFQIGGELFDFGYWTLYSAYLGFAGNASSNNTGRLDVAVGPFALFANSTGYANTAAGYEALGANTTGSYNTAIGSSALALETTGVNNTGVGLGALSFNTTGINNTALGYNTGNPVDATTLTGASNLFIGYGAAPSTGALSNAGAIGVLAEVSQSNSIVLGGIAGVNGATVSQSVGIGTTAPASTLDVHGTGNFTGNVTFASTQTFPGTGTITGVTAGSGLSGGGGSGNVTLAIDTTKVMTGITAGTDLTGGGTGGVQTLNLDTTKVPQLAAANTFTGNQTVNGNLNATGVVTGSGFQIGSNLFDYGSYTLGSVFLGFAGNTATMAGGNTGVGFHALSSDTLGGLNTAVGTYALSANTTGSDNIAVGNASLYSNTTGTSNVAIGSAALGTGSTAINNTAVGFDSGSTADGSYITGASNTFLGYGAAIGTGTINNSTAIGVEAEVSENDAIVLGSIAGVNGASVSTSVGIGTTAPISTLDVDANVPSGLGPTLTLTNNGGSGQVSIDFNTYKPSTQGIYNPASRIEVGDDGGFTDIITFQANKQGAANQGLQTTMSIDPYGDVHVYGTLSKASGSFKIDHPLDPADKYLYHSFVESPDMKNIYDGNITTNSHGVAEVLLPDYFEALNRDFRYQLTVIGQFAQAIVLRKIGNNRFTIKTSKPGVEVSWQVTGIRHDAYADAHRIQVEVEKPPQEQGRYLHPELFGAPAEQAIGYHPLQPPSRTVDPQLATATGQQTSGR
jgi:hypothetical protein